MDLEAVMRTTFAARDFTDQSVDDNTVFQLLDLARFAPSGGNRQGWRVLVIKDQAIREKLKTIMAPTIQRYKAQAMAGETPFNTINPSAVSEETVQSTSANFPLVDNLATVPALLVVCVDLTKVSAFDMDLNRVGLVPGASIYPFAWNILLAARNLGLGGVLTTFLANQEPLAREVLNLPDHFAVACMLGIGYPVKQLTKLSRKPVSEFARVDTWDGEVFKV